MMFEAVLKISLCDLIAMMNENTSEDVVENIEYELEHSVMTTSAIPFMVDSDLYDADDMSVYAVVSRWINENCGLNKTTIYVEVEY